MSSSCSGADSDVVAASVELVRAIAEDAVEDLLADRDEIGVRHPRSVEALAGLALLVVTHLREGDLVDLGIASARDERRHPTDRERAALVAGRDEQLGVRIHQRRGHGHGRAVGQDEGVTGVAEVLDDAEQVVPAAGVEAGGVIAQLVQDLVHLERRGDRLDQHRRPHRAVRDAEPLLGEGEDVVPQPRLEVALGLGRGRSTGRCRGAAVRRRCGRSGGRSRRVRPTAGSPSTRTCCSSKCQPRGRTTMTASRPSSAARTPCLRGW